MPPPSADLSKPIEELINDLDGLAATATSNTNPKANTIAIISAIGKFTCILTILSKEADEQSGRVVRLTWGLFWLTIVLLIVAVIQLGFMFIDYKTHANESLNSRSTVQEQAPH